MYNVMSMTSFGCNELQEVLRLRFYTFCGSCLTHEGSLQQVADVCFWFPSDAFPEEFVSPL